MWLILSFLQIRSDLLRKSLMENFIFYSEHTNYWKKAHPIAFLVGRLMLIKDNYQSM